MTERPKWECPNCGTDEFHFPDEMEVWHDCKQIQLDKLKEEIAYEHIVVLTMINGCGICGNIIANEAHGGNKPSAGDHDPAFHVAKAYHVEKEIETLTWGKIKICQSDMNPWPCSTHLLYGGTS